MTDFSPAQLLTLRREFVRDLVDVTAVPPAAAYLSHYNRATQLQFADDATLQAYKAAVESDWDNELDLVYARKYRERRDKGDSETSAAAAADLAKLEATYRLVAARVLEMMVADGGVLAYLPQGTASAWVNAQKETIRTWRTFVRERQGLGIRPLYRR